MFVSFLSTMPFLCLDGQAIRNANRGDSRESIRRKTPIFITCERFARIASNLRFAIFGPPEARFAKKGFGSGTLKRFARIRRFARICESIARIGPSKFLCGWYIASSLQTDPLNEGLAIIPNKRICHWRYGLNLDDPLHFFLAPLVKARIFLQELGVPRKWGLPHEMVPLLSIYIYITLYIYTYIDRKISLSLSLSLSVLSLSLSLSITLSLSLCISLTLSLSLSLSPSLTHAAIRVRSPLALGPGVP